MPKKIIDKEGWVEKGFQKFAKQGINGIVVEKISKELGCSKSSFYWHFKSRSDLIDGLIDYWSGQFHLEVQEELGTVPADHPMEFLQALTDYWRSGSFASTDAAMRRWAATDPRVAKAIASADLIIMDRMVDMFQGFGKSAEEARDLAFILIAVGVATPQLAHLRDTSATLPKDQDMRNFLQLVLGASR